MLSQKIIAYLKKTQEISFQAIGLSSRNLKTSKPLPLPWYLPEIEGMLLAEDTTYFTYRRNQSGSDL